MRLAPMLNIGKADIDEAIKILDMALGEVRA
jgi:hypothetical protein